LMRPFSVGSLHAGGSRKFSSQLPMRGLQKLLGKVAVATAGESRDIGVGSLLAKP